MGYDYTGYGCSTGQPSVAASIADLEACYTCLLERCAPTLGVCAAHLHSLICEACQTCRLASVLRRACAAVQARPLQWCRYNRSPGDIVLYGQSVGSGPSVDLAARTRGLAGVILHSPLMSGACDWERCMSLWDENERFC